MFSTLLAPPQQPALPRDPQPLPPHHEQGHQGLLHNKCTQSGKISVADWLQALTFDLLALDHNPPNLVSRSSLCSQTTSGIAPTITLSRSHSWRQRSECPACPLQTQQHEESDARASGDDSEREGAAPTALTGTQRPDAFALLRSNKRKTSPDKTQRKKAN